MLWATYFGGSGDDVANGIAIGPDGSIWIVGNTTSTNLPTQSPLYSSLSGTQDAFVAKFDPTGSDLLFSSYFGAGTTQGLAIALDSQGDPVFSGSTTASTYPTTSGALPDQQPRHHLRLRLRHQADQHRLGDHLEHLPRQQQHHELRPRPGRRYQRQRLRRGRGHLRIHPRSLLRLSRYFRDRADRRRRFRRRLSRKAQQHRHRPDLWHPLWRQRQHQRQRRGHRQLRRRLHHRYHQRQHPHDHGAFQTSTSASSSAFVAKFNATATTLDYGTYLAGGSGSAQEGTAIALANGDDATVVGYTSSTTFPTVTAVQCSYGGGADDAFLTQFNSTGTGLNFSTYFGGSGTDVGNGLAINSQNQAMFTGYTSSSNFPQVNSGQCYGGSQDAFVAEVSPLPPAPVITAVTGGAEISSNNYVTATTSGITISGTDAVPSSTVTLYRADLASAVGTATASGGGTWSVSGLGLAAGSYAFQATDTSGGYTSERSSPFEVWVETSAPTVSLSLDTSSSSQTPQLQVSAYDEVGLAATTSVTFDVDLHDDGSFSDSGDAGYMSASLSNGSGTYTLSPSLAPGTYRIRADVYNLAGEEGFSSPVTFTIASTSSSTLSDGTYALDALQGDAKDLLGTNTVVQPLQLGQSAAADGFFSLVYNSDRVSPEPIITAAVQTQNNVALPATITAQLTWNGGTPQTAQNYSTTGFTAGQELFLAQQVSSAVSTTGAYSYSMQVVLNYTTPVTLTYSGTMDVVAETSSGYGAGWTIGGVDRLISVTGGVLREYGSGGESFYATSGSGYTSPAGDSGILTNVGGGGYQYTTPDGETWNFNSNGYMTSYVSADGLATTTIAYNGSNQVSTITTPDGATSTMTYSSGLLSTIATGSRTVTLTMTPAT